MDAYILEVDDSTGYRPKTLVENYSSKIWVDRHTENGEVEIRFPDVSWARSMYYEGLLLWSPESEMIMHLGSTVVEGGEDGKPELIVRGKSVETFLSRRALRKTAAVPGEVQVPLDQFIHHLMHEAIGAQVLVAADQLPNVSIVRSVSPIPAATYFTKNRLGQVYDYVLELLRLGDYGVRTYLPVPQTQAPIWTLTFEIYNGNDRRNKVVFSQDVGSWIEDGFVSSYENYRNVAYVLLPDSFYKYEGLFTHLPAPSGWRRHVLQVDSTTNPETSPGTKGYGFLDAQKALAEHQRVYILSGEPAPNSPYKYKRDYTIGDKVRVQTQLDGLLDAKVTEHTWVHDIQGERQYSTVVVDTEGGF